jgi:hypothetical protein
MKKRYLLIGVAIVLILAGTHWFAYHRGLQYAHEQNAPLRENLRADDPFDRLLCYVPVLNAAAKCPEDFNKEDMRKWRDETVATLAEAETMSLDYYNKAGDESRKIFMRTKIDEARSLLAKLPK